MTSNPKRGRPSGDSGQKKQAIAEAATTLFASHGYDNTSIRMIAEAAGVDPRLISHHFGSKASLFASVLTLPPQANGALSVLKTSPPSTWGSKIVDALVGTDGQLLIPQLVGVIKSASSDPEVATMVRAFYLRQSLEPILTAINIDNAKVRASALSSLLVGFSFSDQILGIAMTNDDEVLLRKELIAKLIQTTLTEKLN